MRYISEKHAHLVAGYEAVQQAKPQAVWPERPDAPFRIKTFLIPETSEQD